ncbi:hypothetical protein [Streptomyces sp. NPDC057696]|uniref:hypothetical protein n=1 Tax=Streptomyces sp. NPDC057696 TaxID=3346218 RepID=UPI0036A6E565
MDKAEDAVDKKAGETVHVLEKHGGKRDASKKEHKKSDKKTKTDLDSCETGKPMYIVNIDGSIVELHADGTMPAVSKADESGINMLLTENGGTQTWLPRDGERNPYGEQRPVCPDRTGRSRRAGQGGTRWAARAVR